MNEVITIGVDLAKNVFQVHGVDAEGAVVVRRQLRRGQVLPFFKKQRPCQRRSKISPPGRSKTSPLNVMRSAVLGGGVPVVHRRDPRCFV